MIVSAIKLALDRIGSFFEDWLKRRLRNVRIVAINRISQLGRTTPRSSGYSVDAYFLLDNIIEYRNRLRGLRFRWLRIVQQRNEKRLQILSFLKAIAIQRTSRSKVRSNLNPQSTWNDFEHFC